MGKNDLRNFVGFILRYIFIFILLLLLFPSLFRLLRPLLAEDDCKQKTADGAGEMPLPRNGGIHHLRDGEDTPNCSSVDKGNNHGNSDQWGIFPEKTAEKQKEQDCKNQPAGTHMIGIPADDPWHKAA